PDDSSVPSRPSKCRRATRCVRRRRRSWSHLSDFSRSLFTFMSDRSDNVTLRFLTSALDEIGRDALRTIYGVPQIGEVVVAMHRQIIEANVTDRVNEVESIVRNGREEFIA